MYMENSEISHSSFSDESYLDSRFRSIALLSMEKNNKDSICNQIASILSKSDVIEFKWHKLGGAKYRFAAIKLIDFVIRMCLEKQLRMDVLIWDIEDSRHNISKRDDQANLQIMYYHLFNCTLRKRWPSDSTWELFPDEQSAIDWSTMGDVLFHSGRDFRVDRTLFSQDQFGYSLINDYKIRKITEQKSQECPFVQIADLFAGIGAYSHGIFEKYQEWKRCYSPQLPLGLFKKHNEFSKTDRERCTVIDHLNVECKKHKLSIAFESTKGFDSHKPNLPVNFWLYDPQHSDDKAPTHQ